MSREIGQRWYKMNDAYIIMPEPMDTSVPILLIVVQFSGNVVLDPFYAY